MRFHVCALAVLLSAFGGSSFANEAGKIDAYVSSNGTLQLKLGGQDLCTFNAALFEKGWKFATANSADKRGADGSVRKLRIKAPSGVTVDGSAEFTEDGGGVKTSFKLTPAADAQLHALYINADFPITALTGKKWSADDRNGTFPTEFKDVHLFNNSVKSLTLELGDEAITLTFAAPTQVLLQDNRQWNPSFSLRVGPQPGDAKLFKKGETVAVDFKVAAKNKIALIVDKPVTIVAGPDWVPLNLELEIEAGSALDFSGFGFLDGPAGKHGRVIARPDGQFAFEKKPDVAQRFYGGNLCYSGQFLSQEESDKLAERFARLGYNAVRFHHYDHELVSKQANSVTLNPTSLEQFDYLHAAFAKRGIYVTTDLYVSRGVPNKEVGLDKPGNVEMDMYKILVPVVPAAWENWKAFSKALLTHENPYTKLKYADDPALAWLSMINEGMYGNFVDRIRQVPEWKTEWNKWLAARYPAREKMAEAWKAELKAGEDPAKGSVEFPTNIYANGPRVHDCHIFFADTERATVTKMKAFLKDELGCKALVTNANAWTNFLTDQNARQVYDYVDDHFYIDHPEFIERPWQLPSRCDNKSPIVGGAAGGRYTTFTRLFDKPFTISEYNYSGPGRFRGVGGILTGSMGALQGWGAIWRFDYGAYRPGMFAPQKMGYFSMSNDPLSQAAERASLCLYLRGDMKAAPNSIGIVGTASELNIPDPTPKLAPNWHWLAWVTRVGTQVIDEKSTLSQTAVLPVGDESRKISGAKAIAGPNAYAIKSESLMAMLKEKGIGGADNPSDPAKNFFRSETGEITIDAPQDIMILDTPKTAGGYASAGKTISTQNGVKISIKEADATVWVSALDGNPITSSQRLLVTHLTDLQNTEIKYAESARQTLLDWGKLPHLVRNGKATVQIKLSDAAKYKVWALATSGKRVGEVKSAVVDGALEFTADVGEGAAQSGARLTYEIGTK